ncbi:MAG TPA: zinc-binding dehydrogenase [Verrucomicrobiae bacterium]|nr:zinc-binding dehydrogenase [Verrucomicrobiae bacterium]
MKAFQLTAHGVPGHFELRDQPDPAPSAGEVVVDIHACGLNRLDLWLEEGALPVPATLPRTTGCEPAGVVSAVGSAVHDWRAGDRVAIQSNLFCGQCEYCARGEESVCLRGTLLGVQQDGGFAEKVLVPARTLVRVPDAVTFEAAAALGLASATAMHMLTNRARVRAGDWVLAIGGASGVGSAAIQIARGLGARVISIASTEPKRELARRLGAEFVFDSRGAWTTEVRKVTNKRGVDVVVEHVGGEVLGQAFDCLARCGTVVTCGATAGRDVPLKLWPLFVKQHQLIGSYGRTRADIAATLAWAAEGRLKPVIHKTYPLNDARTAFTDLRAGNVLGKAVVTIS